MSVYPGAAPERALRIALPRPPQESPPPAFPWLATVAPVVGSVGLWAITQSVFALAFAALGPVIAVASVGDSRVSARRTRRRERARFERECVRAHEAIATAHIHERSELSRRAPGARALLAAGAPDPERWRGTLAEPLLVRLGVGVVPSALHLEGASGDDGWAQPQLDRLRGTAALVPAAPVLVDARLGVGFYGPRPLALAAARAILVQLAALLSPAAVNIDTSSNPVDNESNAAEDKPWAWLVELPHQRSPFTDVGPQQDGVDRIVVQSASFGTNTREDHAEIGSATTASAPPSVVIAIAATSAALPRHTRVVVSVGAAGSAIVRHPDPDLCGPLLADFVSEQEASVWAQEQSESARGEGFSVRESAPPDSVALHAVLALTEGRAPGLGCAIGLGGSGAVSFDLVEDGPHAIVGGTTGSGKSELLTSWVVAMAAARPPSAVSFLFVDFKGGAAFEPLRLLPHSVGLITDLDAYAAHRALSSLSAEVRRRERELAAAGVRSIDEWGDHSPVARLIIVVDEYAAMLDEHPELHSLFVDLAARGRSLGIHLILCTQRPGGVVRDSILANSGLRLCLRVNNTPDSIGVVGSNAAALLPALPRGRAVVRIHGGPIALVQVAHTALADISAVSARWRNHPRPRPPWCPPLPAVVAPADLGVAAAGPDLPFGLVDYPKEQRQAVGRYMPEQHGNLIVVGAGGSGKSTLLDAFATAPTLLHVARVFPSLPAVWDALQNALSDDQTARVLLLDDIDAVLLGCPDEYGAALVDLLTRVLREGPGRGVTSVMTAQRLPGSMHALAALCGSPLMLRTSSKQEHLLAGGDAAEWQPDLRPGAALWRGSRVQVVLAPPDEPSRQTAHSTTHATVAAVSVGPVEGRPLAVVSARPHDLAQRLRQLWPDRPVVELGRSTPDPATVLFSHAGDPATVIGDPDAWLSRWGALAGLRETTDVLFDGCSVSEFRTLTGSRDIPPPCDRGTRSLWLLRHDGSLHRASFDHP
jgi:S-DNA-T family DNA segregation ATPase FtsK/SpoIIIE